MYERGMTIEEITKTEHKAERTIYKYMALAYLSPKIVTDIMDATTPVIDLQTLFLSPQSIWILRNKRKRFMGLDSAYIWYKVEFERNKGWKRVSTKYHLQKIVLIP